jgi:glycosyltransferase involved in cell wall biosynthesis
VHLVIIGDGPDAAAVRRAAAEAGVAERVHWLGQVSDEKKYQVLSVADIFVSASQHEGFGLVFLEAMAFGLPVVCYDHGGQTDFLVNGETGYVLPLNDLGLFTQAIRNLYDRPEERRRMAERNRRLVEEFFIDTCAKRYETVFEEAVRGFAAHRGAA